MLACRVLNPTIAVLHVGPLGPTIVQVTDPVTGGGGGMQADAESIGNQNGPAVVGRLSQQILGDLLSNNLNMELSFETSPHDSTIQPLDDCKKNPQRSCEPALFVSQVRPVSLSLRANMNPQRSCESLLDASL